MLISVDYDKTYTADPELFAGFIDAAIARGHEVVCITMRRPDEAITMPCKVIYTSRRAKAPFAEENNINVNIWIDDSPNWLLHNG